jgi:hypothetical protein
MAWECLGVQGWGMHGVQVHDVEFHGLVVHGVGLYGMVEWRSNINVPTKYR